MKWNMRLKAAERGIWKSGEMRRLLGEAGLELSAGKMSALWSGTPTTIRLDDLDVICAVLDCDAAALLINEPDAVAARGPNSPRPRLPIGARRWSSHGSGTRSPNRPYDATPEALFHLPTQPGRVGQTSGRLLLRLPARRPVPRARLR